jgi:hypothetical protein
MRRSGLLFWVQAFFALLAALLCALSVVRRDWIEAILGVDPDGGSGVVELTLTTSLFVSAVLFGYFARRFWRKTRVGGSV